MPSRAHKRSRLDSESSKSEDFSPASSKLAMPDDTKTYAPKCVRFFLASSSYYERIPFALG